MFKGTLTLTIVLFLALSSVAQTIPTVAPPSAGCGPAKVKFNVSFNPNEHALRQPAPGQGLVYVVEVFQRPPGEMGTPTIRVGVNGKWIGANHGTSYLSFPVEAGENHLCVNWQSRQRQLSDQHAVTNFVAEGGKTYFFKVEVTKREGNVWSYDMQQIGLEEAKSFMAAAPLSISRPKD
jgi:hypothetical protein